MTKQMLPSSPAARIELLLRHSDVSKAEVARTVELSRGVSVEDVLTGRYMSCQPTDLVAVAELLDVPVTVLSGQVPINRHLGVRFAWVRWRHPPYLRMPLSMLTRCSGIGELLDSWLGALHSPLAGVGMSTDRLVRAGRESARRVRDGLELGEEPIADWWSWLSVWGSRSPFRALPKACTG